MFGPEPKINYRTDIDGLRAIAVTAVVLNHLSASLVPGGYIGVDIFFVISGFLITQIIYREMNEGIFTFARFYERRARRLFPALFTVITFTVFACYLLQLPSDMESTLRGALGTLFFISNVVFWRDLAAGYFAATDSATNPMLHTWSLAVEEQFYVFFPILVLAIFRWGQRLLVPVLLTCLVLSLCTASALVQSKSVAVFFLAPFRAWEFLIGSIIAVGALPPLQSRLVREVLSIAGILMLCIACFAYDSQTKFPGVTALLPVIGTAAIIHAGTNGTTVTSKLLQMRPMIFVGLISYSLYLWHWPLIVILRYFCGFEDITEYIPLVLITSIGLAALTYHFIEQPFRKKLQQNNLKLYLLSAASVVLLSAFALLGLQENGFEGRFTPQVVKLDKARSPKVPFLNCDGKSLENACHLGTPSSEVEYLIWGDSHALAWAPALDEVFKEKNKRALFINLSACPPLFGIQNTLKGGCESQNKAVQEFLRTHPTITTVVLVAHWSSYFKTDGPISTTKGDSLVTGEDAARISLIATLNWLRTTGKQVALIGPSPVYEKSVPLYYALSYTRNIKVPHTTKTEQMGKHFAFFESVNASGKSANLTLLDPIEWMCDVDCKSIQDGEPLYRDMHHLSVFGAQIYKQHLAEGIFNEIQ